MPPFPLPLYPTSQSRLSHRQRRCLSPVQSTLNDNNVTSSNNTNMKKLTEQCTAQKLSVSSACDHSVSVQAPTAKIKKNYTAVKEERKAAVIAAAADSNEKLNKEVIHKSEILTFDKEQNALRTRLPLPLCDSASNTDKVHKRHGKSKQKNEQEEIFESTLKNIKNHESDDDDDDDDDSVIFTDVPLLNNNNNSSNESSTLITMSINNNNDNSDNVINGDNCVITEELLRDWTGWEDLDLVLSAELHLDSSQWTNIDVLSKFMPMLNSLKLNRSYIPSVRLLGNGYTHLRYLWLNSCQLSDLHGISACAPHLVELYVAFNHLTSLTPLLDIAETLTVLDVEGNELANVHEIIFVLAALHNITSINLQGNPVEFDVNIPSMLKSLQEQQGNSEIVERENEICSVTSTCEPEITKCKQRYSSRVASFRKYIHINMPWLKYLDDIPLPSLPSHPISNCKESQEQEQEHEDHKSKDETSHQCKLAEQQQQQRQEQEHCHGDHSTTSSKRRLRVKNKKASTKEKNSVHGRSKDITNNIMIDGNNSESINITHKDSNLENEEKTHKNRNKKHKHKLECTSHTTSTEHNAENNNNKSDNEEVSSDLKKNVASCITAKQYSDSLDEALADELELVQACIRECKYDILDAAIEARHKTLYSRPSTSCCGARPRLTSAGANNCNALNNSNVICNNSGNSVSSLYASPRTASGVNLSGRLNNFCYSNDVIRANNEVNSKDFMKAEAAVPASELTMGDVFAGSAIASLRKRLAEYKSINTEKKVTGNIEEMGENSKMTINLNTSKTSDDKRNEVSKGDVWRENDVLDINVDIDDGDDDVENEWDYFKAKLTRQGSASTRPFSAFRERLLMNSNNTNNNPEFKVNEANVVEMQTSWSHNYGWRKGSNSSSSAGSSSSNTEFYKCKNTTDANNEEIIYDDTSCRETVSIPSTTPNSVAGMLGVPSTAGSAWRTGTPSQSLFNGSGNYKTYNYNDTSNYNEVTCNECILFEVQNDESSSNYITNTTDHNNHYNNNSSIDINRELSYGNKCCNDNFNEFVKKQVVQTRVQIAQAGEQELELYNEYDNDVYGTAVCQTRSMMQTNKNKEINSECNNNNNNNNINKNRQMNNSNFFSQQEQFEVITLDDIP